MIKVAVKKVDGDLKKISIKGHADYDAYGKDIVCAGVSSVVIGGINALDEMKSFHIVHQSGNVEIKVLDTMTTHDMIVLSTVIVQLETIADAYPDYVKVVKSNKRKD